MLIISKKSSECLCSNRKMDIKTFIYVGFVNLFSER